MNQDSDEEIIIEQTDSEEEIDNPPLPPDIEMMDQSELDLSHFAGGSGSTRAD